MVKIPIIHKWMLKYAFNYQSASKAELFSKMKFAFIDSNGKRYYTWHDKFDMPISRGEQLQIIMQELASRVDRETLEDWINSTKKVAMDSNKDKALLNVIRMVDALDDRMEVSFDEELLMKLACVVYVDDSQDPRIWDEEYEKAKAKHLSEDSKTGLYDFFVRGGLSQYLPSFVDSQIAYQKYLMQANQLKKKFKNLTIDLPKIVDEHLGLDSTIKQKSTNGSKQKRESA